MKRVYNIEDFYAENMSTETEKARAKKWVQRKTRNVKEWCRDNKDVILVLGPIVIGALTAGIRVIGKNVNLRKEKDVKDLYCYDRSLGHYWALRRELTNKEWVEVDRRKKNGERLADILDEFKVLK